MMNDVIKTIFERRSVRNYLQKQVEKEYLDVIIECGRFAPSGSNSQTTRFIVIQKKEILNKLKEMVKTEFSKMDIDENTYVSIKNAVLSSRKQVYDFIFNAPTLIVIANKYEYPNAIADSAIAAQNIMLGAKSLGIGSCYINQLRWLNENKELKDYLKTFGLKEDERVFASVALGYAKEDNIVVVERKGNPIDYVL